MFLLLSDGDVAGDGVRSYSLKGLLVTIFADKFGVLDGGLLGFAFACSHVRAKVDFSPSMVRPSLARRLVVTVDVVANLSSSRSLAAQKERTFSAALVIRVCRQQDRVLGLMFA